MEYRRLGASGLKVPLLSFGTATFGGSDDFFRALGGTGVAEARRLVDICLDAGVCMFDTANSYSNGMAEEVLGQTLKRRDDVLLATKISTPIGEGPNEGGSSRLHILKSIDESLRRLRTDYVDLLYVHEFDATTPVEEVLRTVDDLVTAGKVRYVGASNFSGWQLMKSLAASDRHGWTQYVAHQVSYSLAVRDYEHDLAPLAADQGVGGVVWSPLAWGALTGKVRRGQKVPVDSRVIRAPLPGTYGDTSDTEHFHRIVDVLDELVGETGHSVSQIALNWLMQRPTICTINIGARNEEQLRDNLGAAGWSLSGEQVARLDEASDRPAPFPHDHQQLYPQFAPAPWVEESRQPRFAGGGPAG